MRHIFYLGVFSFAWIGCHTTKNISVGLTYSDIEKPAGIPVKIVSPTSDFVLYKYFGEKNNGLAHGISTVFVVRKKDDQILLKENLYVDEIRWLSAHVVQIKLRPEVIQKSSEVEVIEFNAKSRERISTKKSIK